jgi:putative DNA primase/helicase
MKYFQSGMPNYSSDDLKRLSKMNEVFTHVTYGSTSDIYLKSSSENGHLSWEMIPKRLFADRFLHEKSLAGMNPAKAWLQWPKKVHKYGIYFYPGKSSNIHHSENQLNKFLGFAIEPKVGDVTPFIELIDYLSQQNGIIANYLLDWCAHLLQKPWEKPSVAVVFAGMPGGGKGSLVKPLMMILGAHGTQLNGARLLTGRFNTVVNEKLLVFADEVTLVDRRDTERLNGVISENELTLEPKGREAKTVQSFSRLIFSSNAERVLNVGVRDRRYLLLRTNDDVAQCKTFFTHYHKWLENSGASFVFRYLLDRPLTNFDPRRAPRTSWLRQEILTNLDVTDNYILEELSRDRPFGIVDFIKPSEVVNRYKSYASVGNPNITIAAARSIIGKKLKLLNVRKIETNGGTYYDIRNIECIKKQFVESIGLELEDAFGD